MRSSRFAGLFTAGATAAALALGFGGVAAAAPAATAAPTVNIGTNFTLLPAGNWYNNGESIRDPQRGLEFVFQTDGNLVLYYTPAMKALWASNTVGRGAYFNFQGDGNAVVYDSTLHPVLSSGTSSATDGANRFLAFDWSGRLAVVHRNGDVLYRSSTSLPTGTSALVGQFAGDPASDGSYAFQGDGNLVARDPSGKATWASWTQGHPGAFAVEQADLNLVVYDRTGHALWSSRTSKADCQNRCNTPELYPSQGGELVLASRPHGNLLWTSRTGRTW